MVAQIMHRPIEPFGVEAELDPRTPSEADKEELRRLYAVDGLVLIRNLKLSMDEQLDLCSIFGPVMRGSNENYLVSNVHKEGLLGTRELMFHNDIPYVWKPYLGASLHAVDVADGASATRFASGLRAYERLPPKLRERIQDLSALSVRERVEGRRNRLTDMWPGDSCTLHRLVERRESDGRPYLFANESMTAQIVGLSEADSDALIEELLSYLYADGTIYEHVWTNGDIVIWDNLAIQHARKALGAGGRTLQRVTLAELGYAAQYPRDRGIYEGELRSYQQEEAA